MSAVSIAVGAYLVASLHFILSLAGLSRHESARNGVSYGIAGMALALAATVGLLVHDTDEALPLVLLVVAVTVGAAIGLWRARVVAMTGMPELIALLHSFVGLAAVLVGWNGYLHDEGLTGSLERIHSAEVVIGVFIGAVTFTGSIVANLKLSARMKSAPLMLPGKNAINLGALAAFAALTVWFTASPNLGVLIAVTAVALALAESSNRQAAELTAVAEADRARTAEANANSEAIRAQTAEANANAEAGRAAESQRDAEANAQTAQAESLIRATAETNSAIEAANALAAQATAQANADLAEAQQHEAERQAQIAEQNRRESNARELAAIAASDNVRVDQGLLLGLEAMRIGGKAVDPYLLPQILMRDTRIHSVLLPPEPDHGLGTSFCMLKDGNVLAALGRDDSIYLWDTNTAKLMNTLGGGAAAPNIYGSISCQEHGALIASSANPDATLQFWDIDQGRQTGEIDVDTRKLSFFGFDAAGDVLAIVDPSGIKFWKTAEQRETLPLGIGQKTRPLTPASAAMSHDGRLLAIGNDAGQLQIWDVSTGAPHPRRPAGSRATIRQLGRSGSLRTESRSRLLSTEPNSSSSRSAPMRNPSLSRTTRRRLAKSSISPSAPMGVGWRRRRWMDR